MSDTEIQKSDKNAAEVLERYIESGKMDFYYDVDEEGHIYLVKLSYDEAMKVRGTVIYQMRKEMLETLLWSMKEYKEGIWCIYDLSLIHICVIFTSPSRQ